MRLIKSVIVASVLILLLLGLPNALGSGTLSGKVLHVWSHDTSSSYTEIHTVNRDIGTGDTYAVEQTVLAKNYSGSAGVTLLDVKVEEEEWWFSSSGWYGIYLQGNTVYVGYSEDHSYLGSTLKTVDLDMSVPHTYRIEVAPNSIKFYIDGEMIYEYENWLTDVTKVLEVSSGGTYNDDDQSWDPWDKETTWDLYIDDVKEYWNGQLINEENFDDGSDDFYTDDYHSGGSGSDEEIISSEGVPEFPFLEPVIDEVVKALNL